MNLLQVFRYLVELSTVVLQRLPVRSLEHEIQVLDSWEQGESYPGNQCGGIYQRWDDHRLYHHSRINQSLHLLSALSFLTAYVCLLVNPGVSALIGWIVAMCSRQIGHFFFEPKDYDEINGLSHDDKEAMKVAAKVPARTPADILTAMPVRMFRLL